MSFTFRKYGTFTGPGVDIEYRDNDDFSLDIFEGYFNLDDVAMLLINTTSSPEDYAYLKLDGSNIIGSADNLTIDIPYTAFNPIVLKDG